MLTKTSMMLESKYLSDMHNRRGTENF